MGEGCKKTDAWAEEDPLFVLAPKLQNGALFQNGTDFHGFRPLFPLYESATDLLFYPVKMKVLACLTFLDQKSEQIS